MPNPVVHFEILGRDHESLQQYYRDLFDWNIVQPSPDFPYGIVGVEEQGEGIGGGIGAASGGGPQATFYVQVEDIEASLQKAGELGGDTVAPVTVIPGHGNLRAVQGPGGQRDRTGLFRGAAGLI